MDIKAYIDSGILELYALNLLQGKEKASVEKVISDYPEARIELNSIQSAIEKYAASSAIAPPLHMKEKIKKAIFNLENEEAMDLPLISKFSDHHQWLGFVKDYIPEKLEDGRFSKVLHHTDTLMQMLLVSSTEFEDEIHTDIHESFLILEGKCKCTVGGEVVYMQEGGYMEIPLHEIHRVEIITPRVVAILQRTAV